MPPQPLRWLRARRWIVHRVHRPILAPTKNGGILVKRLVASVVIVWLLYDVILKNPQKHDSSWKTPRWNWWTCFKDYWFTFFNSASSLVSRSAASNVCDITSFATALSPWQIAIVLCVQKGCSKHVQPKHAEISSDFDTLLEHLRNEGNH